jgi:hypothetical protein
MRRRHARERNRRKVGRPIGPLLPVSSRTCAPRTHPASGLGGGSRVEVHRRSTSRSARSPGGSPGPTKGRTRGSRRPRRVGWDPAEAGRRTARGCGPSRSCRACARPGRYRRRERAARRSDDTSNDDAGHSATVARHRRPPRREAGHGPPKRRNRVGATSDAAPRPSPRIPSPGRGDVSRHRSLEAIDGSRHANISCRRCR